MEMKFSLLFFALISSVLIVNGHVGSLRKSTSGSRSLALRQLPPYPLDRFQVWRKLSGDEQKILNAVLGYDKKRWNLPGLNKLERFTFSAIQNMSNFGEFFAVEKVTGMDTQIDVIMNVMNVTDRDVWDCHINHYEDFFWDELVNASIATHFETLGWNNDTFEDKGSPPESENKDWYELTQAEKDAATALCYFPDLWAGDVEIADWIFQPEQLDSATTDPFVENITIEDRPTIEYWNFPTIPLTVWAELTVHQQGNATILGYNETTWDYPGIDMKSVNTSFLRWDALSDEQQLAAAALDLAEFYWDCLIQHYDNYPWSDLKAKGVKHLYEALNWNYASWHGIVAPPSSNNQTFGQLGRGQQIAAKQLCYLPQTFGPGSGNLSAINLQALAPPTRASGSPFS